MTDRVAEIETGNYTRRSALRLGFWTSILTAVAAAAALVIAITTAPARSGPNRLVGPCITYPYTDAAAFVPNDYLWMYPAFLLGPLFVMLVACIHHCASADKRVFSHIALVFAAISATALATDYFIQLSVMQPSLLKGELDGLSLFSQYNPHGVFIALEDVGYLMMGVAFLFAAPVFGQRERLDRVIRILLVGSSILAIGSLPLLALIYGSGLEYRYEVVALVVDWVALIIAGVLLSLFFRRGGRQSDSHVDRRAGSGLGPHGSRAG